ncbi:MAG: DUF5723 family protein [Salinibacter sp.]
MAWRRGVHLVVQVFLIGLLAGGLAGLPTAHAQSGARSSWAIGTGGGASAVGSPTSALYTNPSHLTVGAEGSPIEIRFFDVRTSIGGDLLQFNHYKDTFGEQSGTLTNAEEAAVLDEWFGGGQKSVTTYAGVVPFSITYQPKGKQWAFGVGLRSRTISKVETNRGAFDLFLVGADSNRTVPLNGRYRVSSTIDLTGSFSYVFESIPLSVGVSPRLIFGTNYADGTLDSKVTVTDSVITHSFDYTARAAGSVSRDLYDTFDAFSSSPFGNVSGNLGAGVAGLGVGLDVGATYAVRPDLFVSMSLTDLGTIQWNRDAQTVTPENNEFRFEGVELDLDRLEAEYDNDVGEYFKDQVDSLAQDAYEDVQRDRSSFSTGLPTALHLGGTWARDQFTLTGGATVGLNADAGAVSTSPAVHLGGEYQLGPIPLRAGVRLGGPQAVTLAGGIGVNVRSFRFDLGVSGSPSTSALGSGGRYSINLSLATVRF